MSAVNPQESINIPLQASNDALLAEYISVRAQTEKICRPLEIEDYVVQSMPDVSPTRWHLAHMSWFFETFVLSALDPAYKSVDPIYDFLFNSYYNLIGDRWARPDRGLLTRPTVRQIYEYRAHVDRAMIAALTSISEESLTKIAPVITLGLNHEQQHQELILTDVKHVLSINPMHPRYSKRNPTASHALKPIEWKRFDESLYEIGFADLAHVASHPFSFDNERPRHRVYLNDFAIADRLITSGEYLEFIRAGGYSKPEIWLSDGWGQVQMHGWKAPLYWDRHSDGSWWQTTLNGYREVQSDEPVTHVSFYEAEAFAAWYGARLPREEEWEVAAMGVPIEGSFVEAENFHPAPINTKRSGLEQLYGEVWQWTSSNYLGYPGFRAPEGALGEYNGKFMSNQMVLRGASCVTPRSHARITYRNFFPPQARWQFSGIRLAR
jgi:ergothioneine biosynthesis protein EgtB